MPAVSKAQQRWAAGWEHNPEQMHGEKPDMTKDQMHDFAATKLAGLPARKSMSKSKRAMRDRSTRGSPPMSVPEMRKGYRCV